MAWNLCLEDSMTVNKFNDTLHMSFVKHDIYQKVKYLHSRAIYRLPLHISRYFESLDELIACLMHENHRSCKMFTKKQESHGFSWTMGDVKESIWIASIQRSVTCLATETISTCNIWNWWGRYYNRATIRVFAKENNKEPGWGSEHQILHQYWQGPQRGS